MYNTMFYIIVLIIILDYLFERWLNYLNSKTRGIPLPAELNGIFNQQKYEKSLSYDKENSRFSNITSTFNVIIMLVILFTFGFAYVDHLVGYITENLIWKALLFFAILGFAFDLIHTPLNIYDTFVIEEKFGFNKTTPIIFIFDKIKGWAISLLLGGSLMFLILWFYYKTTSMFWIYSWIIMSFFMIFFAMFYSNIIVPLFNKQAPLEEGELKSAIQNFAIKVGFTIDNIYTIDGSKRSTKANAYFTGLGRKKRIVLYDTLIKELSVNEIVAVLAHEIGHYKKKHTVQSIVISILQTGLTFFLISIFLKNPSLSHALGVRDPSFHIGIIAFGILYSPISLVIGLLMNILSRRNEYQADTFAKENFEAEHLITALNKLSANNLSNLTPHPIYVFFHYSHPTLLQRIEALKSGNQ